MQLRTLLVCLLLLSVSGAVLCNEAPAGDRKKPAKNTRIDLFGDPLPPWASARLGKLRLRHRGYIRHLVYSDDGTLLAAGSTGTVQVGGRSMAFKEVTALAISKDNKVLAVAERDFANDLGLIKLWDLSTRFLEIREIREPETHILALAYSPDGKVLAGVTQRGGGTGLVRLWNTANGDGRTLCRFQHSGGCHVAFSPDGKSLACPGDDDTVCIVELATGKTLFKARRHESEVTALAFLPDGKTLISGSKDRTIRFWDLEKKKESRCLEGHDGHVLRLSLSANGKVLASQDSRYAVRIWETSTGKELVECRRSGEGGMALSPDGKTLALAGSHKAVDFWDVPSGLERVTTAGHRDAIISLAFSEDGATLASASIDETVRLWDPASMKVMKEYPVKAEVLKYSPKNELLLGDGKGRFWLPGKEAPQKMPAQNWKVEQLLERAAQWFTGKEAPPTKRWPASLVGNKVWSPDGRVLAQVADDGSIRLVEFASGKERRLFQGHADKVTAAAFSANGKMLASGSADTTIVVWNVYGSPGEPLDPKKLPSLWEQLAHHDPAIAFSAVCALIHAPKQSVPFVKKQLQSVMPISEARLLELLTDLDSERFLLRKKAMSELQEALEDGRLSPGGFEREMRKKLTKGASLELIRRGQQLLKIVPGLDRSPGRLRQIRALEVLEQAGKNPKS